MRGIGARLGLIAVVLLVCNLARAETPAAPAEPWLLGNWGGVRTRLAEKGVDFQIGYASEVAYNAAGGAQALADYAHQVTVGATLNLDRLGILPRTVFQVSYTERAGRNLVDDAGLNTLMLVQEVYGRGQTTRLTQMWLETELLKGVLFWKWGRLTVGGDFADFFCDFQNLTFCGSNPGNIVGGYIFNWPISQWGTRVKVMLDGFGYVQAGLYDQNEEYLGYADKLLPVWYSGSNGVLVPLELAWLPKFAGGRLPGSYKIGAWYSTSSAADVVRDVNGELAVLSGAQAAQQRGLYGAYLNFQQQVTRNASENPRGGLNVFLNAVMADRATSVTDKQIAVGLTYTGPFSSRPNDVIGFAAGTTQVNSQVVAAQSLQTALGLAPPSTKNSEYVLELYYTLAPVPGLLIRPNLQYVFTPEGTSANKNILVLGLKTAINF